MRRGYFMYEETASEVAIRPKLLGCECHATTLHNKGPNHVALWIHPNVLVFSET